MKNGKKEKVNRNYTDTIKYKSLINKRSRHNPKTEKNSMTEIYDVTNYDDEELYEILGFNLDDTPNPEPETIENTIIKQLQDYQYSRTVTGRKMYQFLKDIYNHFFTEFDETEDNPDDDFTYRDLNVLENVDYNPDQVESTTSPSDTTPDIDDYITTDDDGIAILSDYGKQELGNPSDGEIEAKIIDLLQKATTKQEFNLYRTLYQTLFETNTEEEIEKVEEALQQEDDDTNTNTPILQTKMTDMKTTTKDTDPDINKITYQKDLNYTPGVVNPILKETYKRIVSVDSQFREDVYPQSTDFTLNFTETLKDVVSMKLYAVQIPVTWYTISKNYGSNFFYLKPANTTHNYAIYNNPNHEYKVEIEPGNYTPQLLAEEINTQIQALSTVYPDVSFGSTTGFNYVTATTMGTFTFDIQKVYNEAYYSMEIRGDILNQALQTTQTQQIQNFQSIQSNLYDKSYEVHKTETDLSNNIITYGINQDNNTITIIQYTSSSQQPNTTTYDQATDSIIETIEIKLFDDPQTPIIYKTVDEIFTELKDRLENHPKLSQSTISIVEPTSTSFYYNWTIRLNNKTTQSVPNSKIQIQFTGALYDINNANGGNKTLWVKNSSDPSAFNMPSDIMEPHVYSQTLDLTTQSTEYTIPATEGAALVFRPLAEENNGVYISDPLYRIENDLVITIPPGTYTTETLITAIQSILNDTSTIDPRLIHTKIEYNETYNETIDDTTDPTTLTVKSRSWTIRTNINHYYTTHDYRIVFYDVNDFTKCTNAASSYRNASADTTLGYILGFKDLTEYDMEPNENTRIQDGVQYYVNPDTQRLTNSVYTTTQSTVYRDKVTLRGGSVVNTSLYNYFMIILDDFNQNHLNDGLVTVAPNDNSVTLPHYATRKNYRGCTDPITNTQESSINNNPSATAGLTQNQIYSIEQIIEAQNQTRSRMSNGPYVKDMFALLPVKASSAPGSMYVEFGGTLQQQERVYFGPVNIRRIAIKLCNDKGDVVDLNGNNWSFQLVCEQLYRKG